MMVGSDRVAPRPSQRGAVTVDAGSQPEEAFARALREKGLAAEDADAGDDADANDSGTGSGSSQASALTCPIAPLPVLAGPPPAPGCQDDGSGGGGGPTAGPTAGIEANAASAAASAAAVAARSMLASTADADATAWEASVGDGSGVAIALRAEAAPPGPGERATWSVMIASPALAAETLARHAPRLTDRLRRRGIASNVRIDGALEDATHEST